MRVISGSARGLKLSSPDGEKTRPTLDRVKEAVFSMLLPYISGAKVLDLFAGSGALGIEALSRGADKSFFIDNSKDAISCIRKNLNATKFTDNAVVKATDAIEFLLNCNETFDLIFLDPPYSNGLYEKTIDLIFEKNILEQDGLLIIEQDFDAEISFDNNEKFQVFKEKKYGRVGITVLKWR